ncbi:high affinity immunoglobulin gamma Fc receptor I-like [Astatotilapia calliptera]|uniref:high affinity immunoglobulin gamma Fc receptor I-like n=1 Tax=Astatotilapia calliptera TaxID=8154 RepID=UPI000E4128D2|nr:high affinity immunoglobulin gamma Fc receptor I-like [Astatotilapia calliptera]
MAQGKELFVSLEVWDLIERLNSLVRIPAMVMILFLLIAEDQKWCYVQKSEGAYLHVHPNRLQFFEYDSISLNCSGFHGPAEWRVIKKLGLNSTQWETSTRTLYVKPAFKSHSGEYWCENEDGEKSSTVNITITSGDVILEIPAFPVMEGDNIALGCKKKTIPSSLAADFYKDGHYLETGYVGKITIPNISKSNEGLYKCIFTESQGKSPESWLTVGAVNIPTTPQETIPTDNERTPEETPNSTEPSVLLPSVFTILGVAVLVVIGALYCRKNRVLCSYLDTTSHKTIGAMSIG